jgi:hypothetical protein
VDHVPASGATGANEQVRAEAQPCDYCGASRLVWRKCKLVCEACRQINKSCADL